MKRLLPVALCLCLLLSGCEYFMGSSSSSSSSGESDGEIVEISEVTAGFNFSDQFTDNDLETGYIYEDYGTITLSNGASSSDSSGVSISGDIITITAEGSYLVSGSLSDGQIVIEVDDNEKVQLVLDGVSISNDSSAAIYVVEADKVFITTTSGSVNTLSVSIIEDETAETNIDAAIFSKADLSLNGNGTLTITTTDGNGITTKDDLVIGSGDYIITADKHGLEANDSIRIADGDVTITSEKDGLHCDNSDDTSLGYIYIVAGTFDIDAQGDGMDSSNIIEVEDGDFNIVTAGGSENAVDSSSSSSNNMFGQQTMPGQSSSSSTTTEETVSTKGIKADSNINIFGGNFNIDCVDDALQAGDEINIVDGTFEISAGDDAVRGELLVNISGGTINITTCYEGLEAHQVVVSGGYVNMYCTDDGINATISEYASADTEISISISGGTIIMDCINEGDGLDSNGSIYISGGYTLVSSTTETTDTQLDYASTGVITGGTYIGTGSDSITKQNFGDSSTQCSIMVELNSFVSGSFTLTDSSGNVIVEITPPKSYATVTISTPDLEVGETYYLTTPDGTVTTIEMDSYIYGEGAGENAPGNTGGTTQGGNSFFSFFGK